MNTLTSPVRQASPYVRPTQCTPIDRETLRPHSPAETRHERDQHEVQTSDTRDGAYVFDGQLCERPASALATPQPHASSPAPQAVTFYDGGQQRPASAKVCHACRCSGQYIYANEFTE
jgi:hypothetical protein